MAGSVQWLSAIGFNVVKRGVLEGRSFGDSSYVLYEACPASQAQEDPVLFVWLHGQDRSEMPAADFKAIQRRLCRRTFFLVPQNPEPAADGRRFLWGLSYTREQNKDSLGFVFGRLQPEYLEALAGIVRRTRQEVSALHVLVCGYSMGGFGALQLGSHAPDLFDAVVSVAGHGLGTLEPADTGYRAPQPESSRIFKEFLLHHAPKLATVRVVIAVHAEQDIVSVFEDAEAIIGAIKTRGGNAELVVVPEHKTNTDLSRRSKLKKHNHAYYNYTFLSDDCDEVLYSRLRAALPVMALWKRSIDGDVAPADTTASPVGAGAGAASGRAGDGADAASGRDGAGADATSGCGGAGARTTPDCNGAGADAAAPGAGANGCESKWVNAQHGGGKAAHVVHGAGRGGWGSHWGACDRSRSPNWFAHAGGPAWYWQPQPGCGWAGYW